MKTVHIGVAKDTLSEVPKPPVYLNDQAKDHYKQMGARLAKLNRLKETYLPALEIYAESMALWEHACRMIREENKVEQGKGYIQVFRNGVIQNSPWLNHQNTAIKRLMDCFTLFGLDPKSDKALKDTVDPNQMSLFEELRKKLSGA